MIGTVPARRRIAVVLGATLIVACASPTPVPQPFPAGTPRLVLFLVVDQLGQEYLERFRPLLQGGLGYLLDRGVVFADAHQDHARTVTGVGHATLASGCFPRRSGIIANSWRDRASGEEVYCVQGELYRRSPANLLVSTIGDWIRDMDPEAKVFAAGGKDRSAILMGGHDASAALWYDGGEWVTSGYYDEPPWLAAFNRRRWLDDYFGDAWEPLPVAPDMLDALGIAPPEDAAAERSFPYAFGGKSLRPDDTFYEALLSSPFSDLYLAELARTMIMEEGLGADTHPDFLALGFHALDYVGHGFGPNSREVLDTVLRLDSTLGELFDFVDAQVGLDRVVISLSSDHGVAPLPAYRQSMGESGERVDSDDVACFQRVGRALRERFGDYDWLHAGLYLNDSAIAAAGIDRAEVEGEIVRGLMACDSIERVWTRTELLDTPAAPAEGTGESFYRQLFANSFHPDRSPDFEIQYTPYYLDRMSAGTTHGSPHRYDSWVPMIVMAPGIEAATIGGRARTIDLAPTLAGIIGVRMPPGVDGRDRSGEMQRIGTGGEGT